MNGPTSSSYVIGIDPGVTTGFVVYDVNSQKVFEVFQTRNINEIASRLKDYATRDFTIVAAVVIEDFVGAGPRDYMAIQTIKALGFFEGFSEYLGLKTYVRAPQSRKPFVSRARQVGGIGPHATHTADALAHVLSYIDWRAKEERTKAIKRLKSQSHKGKGNVSRHSQHRKYRR